MLYLGYVRFMNTGWQYLRKAVSSFLVFGRATLAFL